MSKLTFSKKVRIIGINPYISVPKSVLNALYKQAGKDKGPIPVRGTLQGKRFTQTVIKYQGAWRLYLNTLMRKEARIDVGDIANVELEFDPSLRIVAMHPKFVYALSKNKKAKKAFEKLAPSHRKEIMRYLNYLKNEDSLLRNIEKVIHNLLGKRPAGLNALMRR